MVPKQQRTLKSRWQLGERLNGGGQGQVFSVTDITTSQPYAAKIFRVKGYDTKKLARVKTEIQAIKRLSGAEHVIQIYDDNIATASTNQQVEFFYVMDRARYGSLADNDFYIGDIEQSLRMFRQILLGVKAAHDQGVIHRDMKPANILLYPTQRDIVVTDFGLGLIKDRSSEDAITEADEMLGPRYFMAPEQHQSPSDANERSDIYSLGKILYFMLTGKGKVYREKLDPISEHLSQSNPYAPQIEEKLLSRMVAENPEDRFNDVAEAIDEVDRILDQVDANSHRYITTADPEKPDAYAILIGGRRDAFINSFAKDLSLSIKLLELVSEFLIKANKSHTFESLRDDLRARHKSGKARSAIDSTLAYVVDPQILAGMIAKARYSFPSYYMARYYLQSMSFDTAHTYIARALEIEHDSSLRLPYLLVFEEVSRKCGCHRPHDYDYRILELLRESPESARSPLLSTLGAHYIDKGNPRKGLRFLEAYLELKPYDHQKRWRCAWNYVNLGETTLGIHHYSIYLTHNPDSSEVMNNLGHAYEQKKLTNSSTKMYREAYERGHSLAGSNIAALYMKVGMVDDARKLLNDIILSSQAKPYHDNVALYLGEIVRSNNNESTALEKLQDYGTLVSRHSVQAIRSLVDGSSLSWIGGWKFQNGQFAYTEDSDSIRVTGTGVPTFTLGARVDSSLMEIYVEKGKFNNGYKEGVFYLTDEDNFEGYVQKSDGTYEAVRGSRLIPDEG